MSDRRDILITNATYFSNQDRCFYKKNIRVKGDIIVDISEDIGQVPNVEVINGDGCVIYPGLVNTHHHLFQSILKAVPQSMSLTLSGWLDAVPLRYGKFITQDILRVAVRIGFSDLLRGGVTATVDHHYLYFGNLGDQHTDIIFEEADRLGIKLCLARGFSLKNMEGAEESSNELNKESLDQLVGRLENVVNKYHQTRDNNTRCVAIAPGTPFHSCSLGELDEIGKVAQRLKIRRHSHLSETREDYVDFCMSKYHKKPVELLSDTGWLGPDVWFAHAVHLDDEEINLLAESGTAISHCPTSNARLGTGIAPITKFMRAGIKVGIGVDGAASAESNHMLSEVNLAMLLQKAKCGPDSLNWQDCIVMATKNGAEISGFNNTGEIAVGKSADLVIYDVQGFESAGYHLKCLAPILSNGRCKIKYSFVNGRMTVKDDVVVGIDPTELCREAEDAVYQLKMKL